LRYCAQSWGVCVLLEKVAPDLLGTVAAIPYGIDAAPPTTWTIRVPRQSGGTPRSGPHRGVIEDPASELKITSAPLVVKLQGWCVLKDVMF
jgi:hypothetical protein